MSEALEIQFQCTYADYREANLGHIAAQRPAKKSKLWSGLAGWVVFVALGVVLVSLIDFAKGPPLISKRSITPTAAAAPVTLPDGWALTARFIDAASVSLLFCGLYAVLLIAPLLRRPRLAWLPPEPPPWWTRLLAIPVLVTVLFFVFRIVDPFGPSRYETLLSVLPLALMFVISIAFTTTNRRREPERRWDAQPFLRRPHSLVASEAGIRLDEPLSAHQYQWDYFPGFRETANALLLYVSPYGFWIFPKRAFACLDELEAFKALLLTHVKVGTLLPAASASGFPVKLLQSGATIPPADARVPPAV